MKKIRYERDWSVDFHKDTSGTISEKQARKRFETRKDIAVVVEDGDDVRALCIIFHPGRFCAHVYFLNASLQVQLHLGFETSKKNPSQLFMDMRHEMFYDWVDGTQQFVGGHLTYFSEDGKAKETMGREGFHSIERTAHLSEARLGFHYEPIPAFGEWDSVMRFARRVPVDQDTRKPGQLQTKTFPSEIKLEPIAWPPQDPVLRAEAKQRLLGELAQLSPMPSDEALLAMNKETADALLDQYHQIVSDLDPLTDVDCIEPILASFGYGDPHGSVYWAGIELLAALSRKGHSDVVGEALCGALKSDSPARRLWGLGGIWKAWNPRYVDNVVPLLQDPLELVRESAVYTLESMNDPRVLPDLERMKEDPSARVRERVQSAIRELKITKRSYKK